MNKRYEQKLTFVTEHQSYGEQAILTPWPSLDSWVEAFQFPDEVKCQDDHVLSDLCG
jgi:hypothetical protein